LLFRSFQYDKYLDFETKAKADWKSVKGRAMQGNTNLFINGIITFGNEESNLSRLELNEIDENALDIAAYRAVQRLAEENGVRVLYVVSASKKEKKKVEILAYKINDFSTPANSNYCLLMSYKLI